MNREVLRLRDSAQAAQKLNCDYGVTLNRPAQRARGGVQGPQWLNGPLRCGLHRRVRRFAVWFRVRKSFAAPVEAGPNREASRSYASVWRTRLAVRLLGRRTDAEACKTYGSI